MSTPMSAMTTPPLPLPLPLLLARVGGIVGKKKKGENREAEKPSRQADQIYGGQRVNRMNLNLPPPALPFCLS